MALLPGTRHIDAKTVIVDHTVPLPTFPDRPEPVRREVRWLAKSDLMKYLDWDEAQFEAAQAHNFPIAAKRPTLGGWGITLVWRDDAIDQWRSEIRATIAELTD